MRRAVIRTAFLIVLAMAVLLLADSIAFSAFAQSGWRVRGPFPILSGHVRNHVWALPGGEVPLSPGRSLDPRPTAETGLELYLLDAGPHLAGRPLLYGTAVRMPEGEMRARVSVSVSLWRISLRVRERDLAGTQGDLLPAPPAEGWQSRILPVRLLILSCLLAMLLGWPLYLRDFRAWRVACREKRTTKKATHDSLPRPFSMRRTCWRIGGVVVAAAWLVLLTDAAVFPVVTHNAWRMQPAALTRADEQWWRRHVGDLPAPTMHPINPPPSIHGRDGAWYNRHGGRGGDGMNSPPPANAPTSLLAYAIRPSAPFADWPVLRGRALAGADFTAAYRVGVPLPFVSRERSYVGGGPPPLTDPQWRTRTVMLPFIGNVLVVTIVFGWPIYLRDVRACVRLVRGQCTHCGYLLKGTVSSRCSECGCPRG